MTHDTQNPTGTKRSMLPTACPQRLTHAACAASTPINARFGLEQRLDLGSSDRGFDILVQAKQVGRVVLVLERDEPSVVFAIGGPDPRRFLGV